jgi:regulator of PEP synthase PpsR (kinase-PPPase family)
VQRPIFRNSFLSTVPATANVEKSPRHPVRRSGRGRVARVITSNQQPRVNRVEHPKNYFHLHLISDSTGETLMAAGRAASAQFQDAQVLEHVYPLIRNRKQLAAVLDAIDGAPGIVLYTIVDQDLSAMIEARCREMGVPSVSVLEPIMTVFQSYLGAPSKRRVGAQHVMNAEYFRRIDALNYTMDHDDGQIITDYEEADVVLVGISRTSKTPTSIYLANRGVKTANFPIVPGNALPPALENAARPLVVGLVASTERIAQVRQNRILGNAHGYNAEIYTDRASIAEELKHARSLCLRKNWPMIDVTRKSIEETAAAILALRGRAR